MDPVRETQMAHQLLKMMSRHKGDLIPLFYDTYRRHFSIIQVPPVQDCESGTCRIVKVRKDQAIRFIKQKYQFYDKAERYEVLAEIAEELQRD